MTRQKLHHVFHDSAEITFSGHQNAENELIQRYVPFNRGVSKMKKNTQPKKSTLEQWVTRLGKNRIFMPPECKK